MADSKYNDEEMKRKYRPFVNLWQMCTPEFNQLIRTLMVLIRQGDYDAARHAGSDPAENFKRLLNGWKRAQKLIASELVIRLERTDELEKEKKTAHAKKDYDTKQRCIRETERTRAEISILRRSIDSIIWTMLGNEHSAIRRLPINGNPDNLSAFNIQDSMSAADDINDDPLAMAVITDMTTFVHTGDLFALIPGQGTVLIELKKGEKNIAFSKAAEFAVLSDCPHFEDAYTKEFDERDLKHYQRTLRQYKRAHNVIEAINTGNGFDNFFQSPVKIHDRNFQPDFYTDRIISLWHKIYKGKTWAIDDINECLFIGAYSNSDMGFVGFNSWKDRCKVSGTVYNILDSFHDPLSRPFFSLNLPDKLLLDIISGELIVVFCLDYKRFTERAEKKHPGLYYYDEFPPTMGDPRNLLSVDGKGIAYTVGGNVSYIGNGYETRIIFDQHYPDSLIDWSYKMSDLKKRVVKSKRTARKRTKKQTRDTRKRSRK